MKLPSGILLPCLVVVVIVAAIAVTYFRASGQAITPRTPASQDMPQADSGAATADPGAKEQATPGNSKAIPDQPTVDASASSPPPRTLESMAMEEPTPNRGSANPQEDTTPPLPPDEEEALVRLALQELEGKVSIPDPSVRTIVEREGTYIITWPYPKIQTPGPDYYAQVVIDKTSGKVTKVLGPH